MKNVSVGCVNGDHFVMADERDMTLGSHETRRSVSSQPRNLDKAHWRSMFWSLLLAPVIGKRLCGYTR